MCPAHLIGKVLVLAPNPLSGPSPGRLAGSVLPLTALWKQSRVSGPLAKPAGCRDGPLLFSKSQPQSYFTGHSVFTPGGSEGWENYMFFVGSSPICRCDENYIHLHFNIVLP